MKDEDVIVVTEKQVKRMSELSDEEWDKRAEEILKDIYGKPLHKVTE